VFTALSQLSNTRLTDVLPVSNYTDIISPSGAGKSHDRSSAADGGVDDNHSASSVLGGEAANFPLLVGHMLHQTEMELVGKAHSWTFRNVLDRLLVIIGNPVRHALSQVIDAANMCTDF